MAQDIRKMMKEGNPSEGNLREGHESRFEKLLEERLPQSPNKPVQSKKSYLWMKIAAVLIVAGGITMWVYNNAFAKADSNSTQIVTTPETNINTEEEPEILLSAISPEFKKVEDFYLANVNLELARLEITDDNKELIDAFMKQLSDLDEEYKRLNKEITESGISDEMVNAMIDNLKLRVELMLKLKAKLKEIKDAKEEDAAQQII